MSVPPNLEDFVSLAQSNEMKQSLEEKTNKITQDLQGIMVHIRGLHQDHGNGINDGEEFDETDEEYAARMARLQQE